MNRKERDQLIAFSKIKNGQLKQVEAAKQLGMTTRWIRIKYARYLAYGDAGLVHKSRGKASSRRTEQKTIDLIIDLAGGPWHGFGPTLVLEKLEELHGTKSNVETVRQTLNKAGLNSYKRKRGQHRTRRVRKEMFGELIQFDGSQHDWFEGRGPKCTLLLAVDDATSTYMHASFAKSESTESVMQATKDYILAHGIPPAFYVDFGSSFSVNTNNPERDKKTQWERALGELGTKVIHAHSPQAKGRVERANGTLQDRLVKEFRLLGISSIDEANAWLKTGGFIDRLNAKFAKPATKSGNAHKDSSPYNLDAIFCIKETRILTNDNTISHNKHIFQILKNQPVRVQPKDTITVITDLKGNVILESRGKKLIFEEIPPNEPKPIIDSRESNKQFLLRMASNLVSETYSYANTEGSVFPPTISTRI